MSITEKKRREFERLETEDDYLDLMEKIADHFDSIEGNYLDCIQKLLSAGLHKKIKYKMKISAPFSRRQGLLSRLKDWRQERKELKEEEICQKKAQEEDENKQELAKSHKALQEAINRLTMTQNEQSDLDEVLEEGKSETEDDSLQF